MTTSNSASDSGSVHIKYDQTVKVYHRKAAELTARHTDQGGAVLEIGVGVANVLKMLHSTRPDLELHAADIDRRCLELAASAVPLSGVHEVPPGDLNLAALRENPVRFRSIIMCHVLEHLPNPGMAVKEALSLLDEHGTLIIAVPNPLTVINFFRSAVGKGTCNKGHCISWDLAHWRNFLTNILALDVVDWDHDEAFLFRRTTPIDSARKRFEIWLGNIAPALAFTHFAVVKSQPQD